MIRRIAGKPSPDKAIRLSMNELFGKNTMMHV